MTRAERVHGLLYSTDSREELCGRVADLEALALDMLATIGRARRGFGVHPKTWREYHGRAKGLGLEVG